MDVANWAMNVWDIGMEISIFGMNIWILIGALIAILTYFPMWKKIRSDEDDTEQNFLTWFLWGLLDLIIALALFIKGGNFVLVAVYVVGGFTTAYFIWQRTKFSWGWFEMFVLFLTFVCMVIWYRSGERMATVASTIAMLISSGPQLVDAWKKPWNMPLAAYSSYFIANAISTMGGKDWSVEERFYPGTCTVLCFLFMVLSTRKFWQEPASIHITDKSSSTNFFEPR